jgi:UDP-perosamine 4-acetyltransferase
LGHLQPMKVLIVGAGAQGRVIADILRAQGRYEAIEFVDDNPEVRGMQVNGTMVISDFPEALRTRQEVEMIVALGNPDARLAIGAQIAQHGIPLINAIHPSAVIMPTAILGRGIMVGATAVINSNAQVDDHAVVNTGAVVEHDCQVSEGAAIGPGAHLGGRARLGSCAFISTGAIVLSRVSVGARTVVGAGAVVHRDLPDRVMALGVPAKIAGTLDANFDWSRVL